MSTERNLPAEAGAETGLALPAGDMSEWAEALVAQARTDGVELTGEGGLLTGLIRQVLQTGLEVEMADHLGYDNASVLGTGDPPTTLTARAISRSPFRADPADTSRLEMTIRHDACSRPRTSRCRSRALGKVCVRARDHVISVTQGTDTTGHRIP